jgi:hypothetical protein
MSEIKEGARVRITQQYVDNVGVDYKKEARKLVGQEGVAREKKNDVWAIDLDQGPNPHGVNWLFFESELELIS